jgi:hypothetical protein
MREVTRHVLVLLLLLLLAVLLLLLFAGTQLTILLRHLLA